jgi:hypothetical protein
MSLDFYFNQKTQRYHYADREKKYEFISKNKVRELVRGYLETKKADTQKLNQDLFDGKISVEDWENSLAQQIKNTSLELYKIANPTLGQDRQKDLKHYGKLGANLKNELFYLYKFRTEIEEGKLSEAQIIARANQYIDGTYWAFEEGKRESHISTGWLWERRRLADAIHCIDCPVYAGMGWMSIGTLPAIGTRCKCQSNDKCYFEYSKSVNKPTTASNKRNILTLKCGWLESNLELKKIVS